MSLYSVASVAGAFVYLWAIRRIGETEETRQYHVEGKLFVPTSAPL